MHGRRLCHGVAARSASSVELVAGGFAFPRYGIVTSIPTARPLSHDRYVAAATLRAACRPRA